MTWIISATQRFDPDAQDYINRVIAADVAAGNSSGLEAGVQDAINAFVVGCKADGIWNAIKASCIMAGARTLQGCLVPLVGTAPTRFGTAGGWNYNRKTGLQGNGTDNYLDSNRNNNADSQNNVHNSVCATSLQAINAVLIAAADPSTAAGAGGNAIFTLGTSRCRANTASTAPPTPPAAGLLGISRSAGSQYVSRHSGQNNTILIPSDGLLSQNILIFRRQSSSPAYTTSRLAFYSIGESLDLALLDARVTALMNALAAAIP